jgi:hypothetical protein
VYSAVWTRINASPFAKVQGPNPRGNSYQMHAI